MPVGATFDGGIFTLLFDMQDEMAIPAGSYELEISALVEETGGGHREVSAPLTLVVPERSETALLHADDFESGDVSAWLVP